ncbi:MAG: isocitrate/isopropylmalate family dehydrogenase [Candidatus Helarchaeota archaeon]
MKKICLIGGEGIGIEVVDAAYKVLTELAPQKIEIIKAYAGDQAEKMFGDTFPQETKEAIDDSNAILFGATHTKAKNVLLYLRFGLDNFANIRPCKLYKGLRTPLKDVNNIDFLIIRENLEGLYSVIRLGEGNIQELVKKEIISEDKYQRFFKSSNGHYAIKIITEYESKRIAKLACEKTVERKSQGFQGKLTIVHKSNVMMATDGLFKEISYSIAQNYIKKYKIKINDYYVDDMARRLIRFPEQQDVLLTINEYGDILSDLGSELVGGLGVTPSACIGSKHPYFEPVHGSAPDIAGLSIANPIAAILSLKLLLEHLGLDEAKLLEDSIKQYFLLLENFKENWRYIPKDLVPKIYQQQNKFAKTEQITQKIIDILNKI